MVDIGSCQQQLRINSRGHANHQSSVLETWVEGTKGHISCWIGSRLLNREKGVTVANINVLLRAKGKSSVMDFSQSINVYCLFQVLLVSSSRHPDQWIVPGGGMEPEEEPCGAAVREVFEEVNSLENLFRTSIRAYRTSAPKSGHFVPL